MHELIIARSTILTTLKSAEADVRLVLYIIVQLLHLRSNGNVLNRFWSESLIDIFGLGCGQLQERVKLVEVSIPFIRHSDTIILAIRPTL